MAQQSILLSNQWWLEHSKCIVATNSRKITEALVRSLFIILLFCASLATAQTTLSGNIGGITLEQAGNPFIVTDNLTIPEGKSVTIKEGCIFLFKPFTGLIVEGSLKAEGTLQNPVIFTTINDGKYNSKADQLPNPFDWNGILISAKASQVNLSNWVWLFCIKSVPLDRVYSFLLLVDMKFPIVLKIA